MALADVGIALQNEAQENAASNVASIILLGNRLSQVWSFLFLIVPSLFSSFRGMNLKALFTCLVQLVLMGIICSNRECNEIVMPLKLCLLFSEPSHFGARK